MDDKSVWDTDVESFINEYQLGDDITSETDGAQVESNNNILQRAGASYVSLMLELFFEESKTVAVKVAEMPKPRVPYPRKSYLTQSNMNHYLSLEEKFRSIQFITDLPHPASRKLYNEYKLLQAKIVKEQEDFQNYLFEVASQCIAEYNFIQNAAKEWVKECMYIASLAVKKYPRYYVSQKEIGISVVPFTTDVLPVQIGNFVCTIGSSKLLKTIKCPSMMPFENLCTKFSPEKDNVKVDKWKKCNVSEDENAERLAMEWGADTVIAMKALRTFADNPAPFTKEWEVPVVVKTVHDKNRKINRSIAFVNSPLPPKSIIAREKNAMYFKALFKSLMGVEVSLGKKFSQEVGNVENRVTAEVKLGRSVVEQIDSISSDVEYQHAVQKNMDVTLKDNTAVGKSSSDEFSSSEHDEKKHEMMRHNIKISSFAQKKCGVARKNESQESDCTDVSDEQVDIHIMQVDGASDEIRKSKRVSKPTIKKKNTEQQKRVRKRKTITEEQELKKNKKKPGLKRNIQSASQNINPGKGKKEKADEDDIQERMLDEIEDEDVDDSDEHPLWSLPKSGISQGISSDSESVDSADERKKKKRKKIVSTRDDQESVKEKLHAEMNLQKKVPRFLSLKDSSLSKTTEAAKWKFSLNSWFPKQNESFIHASTSKGDLEIFKPYGRKTSSTVSESATSTGDLKSKEKTQPYELSFSSATLPVDDPNHSGSDDLVIDVDEPETTNKKIVDDEKMSLSIEVTQALEQIITEDTEKHLLRAAEKTKPIIGNTTPICKGAWNSSKSIDQSTEQADLLSQTIIASHDSTQRTLTDITSTPMADTKKKSKLSVKGSRSMLQVKLLSPVVRTGNVYKKLTDDKSNSNDLVEAQHAGKKRMGNRKDTVNSLNSGNSKDDITEDGANIISSQHKVENNSKIYMARTDYSNVLENISPKYLEAQNQVRNSVKPDTPSSYNAEHNSEKEMTSGEVASKKIIKNSNPKPDNSSDLIGQIMSSSSIPGYCKTQNVPISDSLKAKPISAPQKSTFSDLLSQILGGKKPNDRQRKISDAALSWGKQAENLRRENSNVMPKTTFIDELKQPCMNTNVSYSLWQFGKKRVLIRYSLDGNLAVKTSSGNNTHVGVSLRAKTEYQSSYAYEQLTLSEACQDWLTMLIKPADTQILRGRIDPLKSKLLCMEWMKTREQLTQEATRIGFNPVMTSKLLTTIFEKLSSFDEGVFICSHKSGESKVMIKKSVEDPSKKVVYDLHEVYKCPGRDVFSTTVPWVPADPYKPCSFHLACKRIPLSFEPRNESVDGHSTVNKRNNALGKKKNSKRKKKVNKK